MSELGTTLKNARIEKGISLDELEQMTKIRKRYLTAIEEQHYDILPGNFYVRAFIKNYAESVGLNPDDILEMYKNEIPEKQAQTAMNTMSSKRKSGSSFNIEKWGRWASAIIMISFFLLIVFLIYFYMVKNNDPDSRIADETPITNSRSVVENGQSHALGNGSTDGENGSAGNEPNETEQEPTQSQQPDEEDTEIDEEETDVFQPEVILTNAQGNTDVYTVTAEDQLEVTIEITGEICWVTVKEDHNNGKILYNAMMSSAEDDGNDSKITWTQDHSLYIVLGRASDATVTVNGVQLEPFGIASVHNLQLNFVDANKITEENT